MYVKLFSKILDSSIWLAPDPHRLVWITLLAACDQDGNALFASAANVAARARVPLDQAREAITSFEGPDPDSGDPENEGRRIERFPGGWSVLNFVKYRDLAKAEQIREQTRLRVQRHRAKKAGNAEVTQANETVTTAEEEADATEDELKVPSVLPPSGKPKPAPTLLFDGENTETINPKARVRLAKTWALPDDWGVDAEALGWNAKGILLEAERFRQYYVAGKGAESGRTIRGWRQSWSNWLSKAERFRT